MTSNIDRAAEVIYQTLNGKYGDFNHHGETADALADAGQLRPDPSSRFDGAYQTFFVRDEDAEDGPYIEACVSEHRPAPEWKVVHRAEVSIDINGQHGYHNLRAYASAEWCREAAAILLDVADEVDYRNNKATADHAEGVGRADA